MGVENYDNAYRALSYVKEKAPYDPYIIVCDFKPALIAAIKAVFPNSAVQIDGFHVMQEVNNGIKRDLKNYRVNLYKVKVNELLELRSFINALQEQFKNNDNLSFNQLPVLKSIQSSYYGTRICKDVFNKLFFILTIQEPHSFFNALDIALNGLLREHGEVLNEFCDSIYSKFPKRKFTIKGRTRVQVELLKKLKTLCLNFRKPLEEEATTFSKELNLLFLQPEKITPEIAVHLEKFLEQHPTLNEYREMTLMVGEIYRTPYELVDGHQIDALMQKPTYSDKLNTAISTLKRYKNENIAFSDVFPKHPELSKACRTNTKWINIKVKAPFKTSFNRQHLDIIENRMKLQLGGEVRNFIN